MADKIKAVFLAALDTPADQRPAYLDRACGGDANVRGRVEALLRAHGWPEGLLDRPAWSPRPEPEAPTLLSAGPPLAANQPDRAGRVHLLGEIARGGMGAVLHGYDPELGRELAVKVILPAHRNNPELVHRFVGEARLAGQLQHPGIVPVYDVGQLADGRPFFAMKLIQGRTLAELLAERAEASHDLPRFLRYFEAVCQAVGYAHAHGVIHRDLKPHNVMVGAFGEVQVMDWGLAKRLAESPGQTPSPPAPSSSTPIPTSLTRPGEVVGTPEYLAPEQALGQAGDQRTDVFGLGGLLCEILTGAPPFRTKGLRDLLQQVRTGDLRDATDRLDHCGGDPELIRLAKECLVADPAGRPADGSVVAARLAEYLAGVQEQLHRAEVGQARAEARVEGERTRRRLAVGLAVAFLAVVALGGGTLLLVERHRAEQAREQVRRQQAAESALVRAADLKKQGRWAEALAVLQQARQRLDERDEQVRREIQRAVVDLELVGRLEKIRLGAASVTGRSFARTRADRAYERAFRAAGLGGPDQPAETTAKRVRASGVRPALVAALDAWAEITEDPGRRSWVQAVARSADQSGAWGRRLRASWGDPAALEVLAREAPVSRLSPHLLGALGIALTNRAEAVQFLRKAQLHHPGDFWLTFFLALRLQEARQLAEAAGFYRAALAARPDTPAVLVNLGKVLLVQEQPEAACDCLRRAIEIDPEQAMAHNNLGNALWAKGQFKQAMACYRKAIAIDPKDGGAYYNLGLALKARRRLDEAIVCWRKAIALDPNNSDAHYILGNALLAKAKPDKAIACWRKAIAVDPKNAWAHYNLGNALLAKGQLDNAIACFRKASAADPHFAEAHCSLGVCLVRRGDLAEALYPLRRGHELGKKRGRDWKLPSDDWVRRCELLIEREKKLLGVLEGSSQPADARERVEWAQLCLWTRRYVAAARLSTEAFGAERKLANDLGAGHRYRAAIAAGLAGVGRGRDAGPLSNQARAALRKQALDWLRADLAAWRSHGEGNQRTQALRDWRADPALAGVRDKEGLAKLPPAERLGWIKLWAEVEQLAKQTP
jgi:serine/threonine-protein kinase